MKVRWVPILTVLSIFNTNISNAQDNDVYTEFSGNLAFENRYFLNDGAYPGQHRNYLSFSFQPEYLIEWKDGDHAINFTGFVRVDQFDNNRTHADIRELYYQRVKGNWDLSIGLKKIYWGVTESVHLVDIINQTDFVESFDGEQKLGQPMVHFSYISGIGTFDLFAMPYFRKRQLPGVEGRLRTAFVLEKDESKFESDMEEFRPDFSARWSNSMGVIDAGLSYFYGTGREPFFQANSDSTEFNLFYGIINQTGLDIQATTGSFLWKFESIVRKSDFQDMMALAAGVEYTFGNVANSGLDIGIIGEYLYDDRGRRAFSSLQNDAFFGARLAFNDTQSTEFLFGGIFDLDYSSKLISVEGSRRFGNSWKLNIEMRLLKDVSPNEFIAFVQDDDFLQFTLAKYF